MVLSLYESALTAASLLLQSSWCHHKHRCTQSSANLLLPKSRDNTSEVTQ